MVTEADIERWFTYHPPTEEQRAAYERIRKTAKAAAIEMVRHPGSDAAMRTMETLTQTVIDLCPDGPEKTEAIGYVRIAGLAGLVEVNGRPSEMVREIRAAVMWANAAIACAPKAAAPQPIPPKTDGAKTRGEERWDKIAERVDLILRSPCFAALDVSAKHALKVALLHGLDDFFVADAPHGEPAECPTYYDGCTLTTLMHNIDRAERAEDALKALREQAPVPVPAGARRCPCGAPIFEGEICNCGRDYSGSTE